MRPENVEVEDAGVVEDVDTPADYERLFGDHGSSRGVRDPQ
jgi:CTP:molybdopterin cytidylyltransferase MocA